MGEIKLAANNTSREAELKKKIISSFMAFNLYHGFVAEKRKPASGRQGINSLLYLRVDSPISQHSRAAFWNVENRK